jgi:hypothetical protein
MLLHVILLLNMFCTSLKQVKNLVFMHRFTCDNHVFLELHPWHFHTKDQITKRVLHHGRVEKGLYPLKSPKKHVLATMKPSQAQWHRRVYISHDVLFDEIVYPFSKHNPNAGARLRGELSLVSTSDRDGVFLTNPPLVNVSNQHVEIAEPLNSAGLGQRTEMDGEETSGNSGFFGAQQADFMQEEVHGTIEEDLACEFTLDQTPL